MTLDGPAPPPTPFADWAATFTPQLTGGFGDDSDADGTPTGFEWYFFGTDPTLAQSHASPFSGAAKTGANTFTVNHRRPVDRDDLTEAYMWSTDMSTWTANGASDGTYTVDIATVGTPDGATGYEDVVATATVSTGGNPTELFLRLELTSPNP